MGLTKTEWERRLKAALLLNGMELADLAQPVKDQGLPKNAAARACHPSDNYMPNHALAVVVAEILGMPRAWFEIEDWRQLVGEGGAGSPATKADLDAALVELHEGLDAIHAEIAVSRKLQGHGEGRAQDDRG